MDILPFFFVILANGGLYSLIDAIVLVLVVLVLVIVVLALALALAVVVVVVAVSGCFLSLSF